MDAEHAVEIIDPRRRPFPPAVLVARCSCSWSGPIRTGRNARHLANTDGREHREKAWAAAPHDPTDEK